MFRGLYFEDFAPFATDALYLPPVAEKPGDLAEVHLFTGVNGTGKTRLLTAFAAMLGNPEPLASRLPAAGKGVSLAATDAPPPRGSGSSIWKRYPALASHQGQPLFQPRTEDDSVRFVKRVASLPAFAYSGTAYLGDAQVAVLGAIPKPSRKACLSFHRSQEETKALLQTLTKLKIQAAMGVPNAAAASPDASRAARLVGALEEAIARVAGEEFAFHVDVYPESRIQASWRGQVLPFAVLPDGLRSIIGTLVHAAVMLDVTLEGKGDPRETELVLLLDEIEAHLHPTWQRRILPAFQRLFPKAQIFVATHSPFVIASLNHGWIHRLALREGRVHVAESRPASQGDSYVSVVEDIMGLEEWFDPETEQLLGEFRAKREEAYQGQSGAEDRARELAAQIGKRSMELSYVMGRELSQMDRQLASPGVAK